MQKIPFTKRDEDSLRKSGVMTVYLFGSRAEGLENELSDYDFAFLLTDSSLVKPGKDVLPLYQKLYEFLSPLCTHGAKSDVIDIVFLQSGVSLELQANVVKNGKILFDDNPQKRADYEAQVMMRMADMQPIIRVMDDNIINRI